MKYIYCFFIIYSFSLFGSHAMSQRSFTPTLPSIPEQRERESLAHLVYKTEDIIDEYCQAKKTSGALKKILSQMQQNVEAIRQTDRDLQRLKKQRAALQRKLEKLEYSAEIDAICSELSSSGDDYAVAPDGELSKSDLEKLMNKEIERQLKLEEER